MLDKDPKVVQAVLEDWESAPVSERIRAALRLLEAITLRPLEIDREFVARVEAEGLPRSEFEEVASVGFHFNFMNRAADAFDFAMLTPEQSDRQSRFLRWIGRLMPRRWAPRPSWKADDLGKVGPVELIDARRQILETKGVLSPELRRAVLDAAGSPRGGRTPQEPLPAELSEYVETLSKHAYRITDEMVDDLKAAGYAEDQIFEVTLLGSFGASAPAFDRLYQSLYQPADC